MYLRDLDEFGGHDIVEFQPDQPVPPTATGWRLEYEEHSAPLLAEEVSPGFLTLFDTFLETVPPSQVAALVLGAWGCAAFRKAPIAPVAAAADRLPALRALFFGDIGDEVCELSWIKYDDVAPVLTAYPNLEVFGVRGNGSGGLTMSPVRHDTLRQLVVESGGLPDTVVTAIAESELPALEELEVWLGVETYGGTVTVETLAPILSGQRFPALRHLRIRNAAIADDIAAALASAPVVARLETLDLSLGTLSDRGADALLAGQSLTHLRELNVRRHCLSEDMCARLAADVPGVVGLDKRHPYADNDDFRYPAVTE